MGRHRDTRQTRGHQTDKQTRVHQTDMATPDRHKDTRKTWTWKYSNAFRHFGHFKYLDIQSIKFGHRDIETLPSMGNCHTDKKRPSKNFHEIFYRQETFSKDFFLFARPWTGAELTAATPDRLCIVCAGDLTIVLQ